MPFVLIATLGAEPQVVTLATQMLLRDGVSLARVVVLHTQATRPPMTEALPRLQQAFAQRVGIPPLVCVSVAVDDVLAPWELDCFADVLFAQVQSAQAQGLGIHLLLAGGRKSMTMVGMSVAHLLLGVGDTIWYLYSDPDLRSAGRMWLRESERAELIPVPLPRAQAASPRYTPVGRASSRADAVVATQRSAAEQARIFWEQDLTRAEREVAALLAAELLTVAQIGQRLHKSPKTVTNQLTSIYSKLESRFGLEPDLALKREFLRRELRPLLNEPTTTPTKR